MEKKEIYENIKSKYIIEKIFEYIKDENFLFKLFIHSKKYQKKLDLDLFDYINQYYKKIGIRATNFFSFNSLDNNSFFYEFDKDKLKTKYKESLINNEIEINFFNNYLSHYIKKYPKKIKEEYHNKFIDIYSPFFEILSQSNIFEYLTITIPFYTLIKNNLKTDYIEAFSKLNQLNSKYTSLSLEYKNDKDLDYIKEFNINFNQIKKLKIKFEDLLMYYTEEANNFNFCTFFKSIFALNIYNNLIRLSIVIKDKGIDPNLVENFNNFKQLKKLKLMGFKFNTSFCLKLNTLKILKMKYCENISFEECCLNLQKLHLNYCKINTVKTLLQLPNVEECYFLNEKKENENYYLIFDFNSFTKLKDLTCNGNNILYFKNYALENLDVLSIEVDSIETEKKIFEKILSIKTLKTLYYNLNKLDNNQISKIKGNLPSVENLYIRYEAERNDYILYDILNKFPNLLKFSFSVLGNEYDDNLNSFEIKENPNCKINKLVINFDKTKTKDIKMYCQPYEYLEEIRIYNIKIDNINFLPLLNDKCDRVFKSLKYFSLDSDNYLMGHTLFDNIYNNLDKMPNLKSFRFSCKYKYLKIDEYENFIKKLLSLNLDYIFLKIDNEQSFIFDIEEYSYNELKRLYPNFKVTNFNNINIYKFIEFIETIVY